MNFLTKDTIQRLYRSARLLNTAPMGWVGNELICQVSFDTSKVCIVYYTKDTISTEYISDPKEAYKYKKAAIETPIHEVEQ